MPKNVVQFVTQNFLNFQPEKAESALWVNTTIIYLLSVKLTCYSNFAKGKGIFVCEKLVQDFHRFFLS